jgi:hypothetical protein
LLTKYYREVDGRRHVDVLSCRRRMAWLNDDDDDDDDDDDGRSTTILVLMMYV